MDRNRYALLYGYLLARIHFGFYPKGSALPSIYRLSDMFGVSTITCRGAIQRLKDEGYVDISQGKRTIVIFDAAETEKIPDDIFAAKETLQDLFQSLYLLVPCIFYQSYHLSSDTELAELNRILERFDEVWDEPIIHYLFYLVSRLDNPLLNDLYADTLLYSYPAHVLRFSHEEKWEKTYERLRQNLQLNHDLRRMGENTALWNALHVSFLDYDPDYANAERTEPPEKPYVWGKAVIGSSIATGLLYRIYCGLYPSGTFLPSLKTLSAEFSAAPITMRRAISLLNKLCVTESINGKGTRVLFADEGKQKINWFDASVRKSILTYFYTLHIFAITCRSVAKAIFPRIDRQHLQKAREEILFAKESGHADAVPGICLRMLIDHSHLSAISNIYSRLLYQLLLGYPLVFMEPRVQLDTYVDSVVLGLESGSGKIFGEGLEEIFFAIFASSKKKILSVGISEVKDIELESLPQ